MISYLSVSHQNNTYPIVKIIERQRNGRTDINIIFRHLGHHITIHETPVLSTTASEITIRQDRQEISYPLSHAGDNPLIFTSFNEKGPIGTWSKLKIQVAESLGINNANRHGQYFENRVIPISMDPFPFGARRIDLDESEVAQKNPQYILLVSQKKFMLSVEFSRKNRGTTGLEIPTHLGSLYFKEESCV